MANNTGPLPKDYSLLIHANFDSLNTRPQFDAKSILDEELDWYLLEYLKEMEYTGFCHEQTLNALLTMIGGLSNDSYSRNLMNGSPVWLNIFSHIVGASGSNKSYLANDIIYALKKLDDKYPNVYSNRRVMNDFDQDEEQPKKKQKCEPWNFLVSSITEAALSKNTNFTDVMIVNPDGDSALKLFSYYEQNNTNGAQGVSCFCNAFDGIEPGSSRVTGVELSKNDRNRPSKLSMYIASTGKKLALPLMKMIEESSNDGIYGRVWYTHTTTVHELPDILYKKQISLPNLTHIALSCHSFFQNRTIEFRYCLFRSDMNYRSQSHISARMQNARRKQNVNLPEFHGIQMDEQDIIQQQPSIGANANDDSDEQLSAFQLAIRYINEVWTESFTLENHIGEMWRKISYHLPKSITTFKVLRLLFRIIGENMLYYTNSQEGNRSYPSKLVSDQFIIKLNKVINEFFERCTRTIDVNDQKTVILLLTANDVEVGYSWCRLKLDTTLSLFSTNQIQHIIHARSGKSSKTDLSLTKSIVQRRMDSAMVKVLMTPTIFFTNGYLSTTSSRGGSGLFKQHRNNDLKPDIVMENLLEKGFIVKCDVIQGTRPPKNHNLSLSYYKQQPSYFEQSDLHMKELQSLGINFHEYKRNYETSTLPKSMSFNNDGIELIKGADWIQFYHIFLSDPMAKSMIEDRVKIGQIIEFNGRYGLNNSYMNDVVSVCRKRTTDESNKQHVQEDIDINSVIYNITSNQLNLLPLSISRLPLNSSLNESEMDIEIFHTSQKMKLCIDKEHMVDLLNPVDDNFHPPCHSTPIHHNNKSSSSLLLPIDHVTTPSHQLDEEELMNLPPVTDNVCSPSLINRNCSIQSMATVLSSPARPLSSNSINKIIEVLNGSSIQFGLTSPNRIMEHHQSHQDKELHIDDGIVDVLQDMMNVISAPSDPVTNNQVLISTTVKKRGRRPLLKSINQPFITSSEIANVVENDSHPIWKKLILNKHILASMSDLSRTVTGSDEINVARLSCIEKLLDIGCFLNGDAYLNGKEKAVLKNSPEDPRLITALDKYGIDMDEYKQSFNNHIPFGYKNDTPIPALLSISTNKNKFTQAFVDKLQSDPFYSIYLRIDSEHVVKSPSLKRKTTSSSKTDLFRAQKQNKIVKKQKNAEKHAQQLAQKDIEVSSNNKQSVQTRRKASNQ